GGRRTRERRKRGTGRAPRAAPGGCGRAGCRGGRWRRRSGPSAARRPAWGRARGTARSPPRGRPARRSSLPLLAQDPLVAHAQSHALLVEPLRQRNGELAALAGQLLEALRVDGAVLLEVREQSGAQALQRGGSKPQLLAHLDRSTLGGQRLEELLRPLRSLLGEPGQLVGAGRRQSCG